LQCWVLRVALILKGDFLGMLKVTPIPQPWSYVILFGVSCPAMWLSAVLVQLAQVPPVPDADSELASGLQWKEILTGLRAYFLNPLIVTAAIGFLLTYSGTMVMNNMSLYARETLGEAPEKYAGIQLALRFGFKCLMGLGLVGLTKLNAGPRRLDLYRGDRLGTVRSGQVVSARHGLLGGAAVLCLLPEYIVSCSNRNGCEKPPTPL
jgi:hypothetical protein